MYQRKSQNIIELFMAFAIFLMVVGELITLHQERMFGFKLYDQHIPPGKNKGADDNTTTHYKSHKGTDKSSEGHLILFALPPTPLQISNFYWSKPHTVLYYRQKDIIQMISSVGLRAPPVSGL
jgi:hypothetical protein